MQVDQAVDAIRRHCPGLPIRAIRRHDGDGQLNEVFIINDAWVFRFPRSDEVATNFATEIVLLHRLQSRLSLPIPNPIYHNLDAAFGPLFMGYALLPGEPLSEETLAAIDNESILNQLATQIAGFVRDLHGIPLLELDLELPLQDGRHRWMVMLEAFRTHLFSYMRPDAQAEVNANFARFLANPQNFAYQPVLCHGDLGGNNILYDRHTLSICGIIDFDSLGVDDPAVDAGALLGLGEEFFQRICRAYPELCDMRERVAFYQSTYALQEALYGLRDGVQESFESGIADYR